MFIPTSFDIQTSTFLTTTIDQPCELRAQTGEQTHLETTANVQMAVKLHFEVHLLAVEYFHQQLQLELNSAVEFIADLPENTTIHLLKDPVHKTSTTADILTVDFNQGPDSVYIALRESSALFRSFQPEDELYKLMDVHFINSARSIIMQVTEKNACLSDIREMTSDYSVLEYIATQTPALQDQARKVLQIFENCTLDELQLILHGPARSRATRV